VTLFLLIGFVVGAMGVFRYQEVAFLSREAARYASTHGGTYRSDAGLAAGTSEEWTQDIIDNAVTPKRTALDPTKLTVTASWPTVINQPDHPDNWPGSKVTVTVSYRWMPELYLIGPITLTSTSELPITN
jgi:Flp pilus assembly protein TadG